MKYLVLIAVIVFAGCTEYKQVSTKVATAPKPLIIVDYKAKVVSLITKLSKQYNIDRSTLSCIYSIESSYRLNVISKTFDHGIGQVNVVTAHWLNLSVPRLTNDLEYSMSKSAELLAYYEELHGQDEPSKWVCRYNIGSSSKTKGTRSTRCEAYLERFNTCLAVNKYW
jgi:Transglycosylase SLT domain